jgi:hypothetical protein
MSKAAKTVIRKAGRDSNSDLFWTLMEKNAYTILAGKPPSMRSLEEPCGMENNIKMELREVVVKRDRWNCITKVSNGIATTATRSDAGSIGAYSLISTLSCSIPGEPKPHRAT